MLTQNHYPGLFLADFLGAAELRWTRPSKLINRACLRCFASTTCQLQLPPPTATRSARDLHALRPSVRIPSLSQLASHVFLRQPRHGDRPRPVRRQQQEGGRQEEAQGGGERRGGRRRVHREGEGLHPRHRGEDRGGGRVRQAHRRRRPHPRAPHRPPPRRLRHRRAHQEPQPGPHPARRHRLPHRQRRPQAGGRAHPGRRHHPRARRGDGQDPHLHQLRRHPGHLRRHQARQHHPLPRPRPPPRRRPRLRPHQDPAPEVRRDPRPLQARRRRRQDQVPPLLLRGDHRHHPPQPREQERLRPRPQPAPVRDVARRRQRRQRRAHRLHQDREAGDHQDADPLQVQAQGSGICRLGHDQGQGNRVHYQGKDRCGYAIREHEAAHRQGRRNHQAQEG